MWDFQAPLHRLRSGFWCIFEGDTETGVTCHRMVEVRVDGKKSPKGGPRERSGFFGEMSGRFCYWRPLGTWNLTFTQTNRARNSQRIKDFDAGLILQQERLQLVWESQSNRPTDCLFVVIVVICWLLFFLVGVGWGRQNPINRMCFFLCFFGGVGGNGVQLGLASLVLDSFCLGKTETEDAMFFFWAPWCKTKIHDSWCVNEKTRVIRETYRERSDHSLRILRQGVLLVVLFFFEDLRDFGWRPETTQQFVDKSLTV